MSGVSALPSGQVFPITNPSAHLACYPISVTSTQPTPTVVVTNQFGSATLVPSQPNLLCVPSWKSLTDPPGKSPTTPPNLNHFTCYPVKVVSGSHKPPKVLLQDEFAPRRACFCDSESDPLGTMPAHREGTA